MRVLTPAGARVSGKGSALLGRGHGPGGWSTSPSHLAAQRAGQVGSGSQRLRPQLLAEVGSPQLCHQVLALGK